VGKDVLCLGFSEAQVDQFVAPHQPGSIQILTLWEDHVDACSGKYPVMIGDITQRTNFADDALDVVLTLSVLEHVSNVGAAFDEMARITRPDGEHVHIFGPAWSCAYGHHLYASDTDANLNFVRWTLPAHMHLLCTKSEVCDFYEEQGLNLDIGEFVWDQFHSSDLINRKFYDDYVHLMVDLFRIVHADTMSNELPAAHLAALREKFPGRRDFSTYGGLYRLAVT